MNEKFTSNNFENNEYTPNIKESDYKNLLSRLKEIRATISSLKKKVSK